MHSSIVVNLNLFKHSPEIQTRRRRNLCFSKHKENHFLSYLIFGVEYFSFPSNLFLPPSRVGIETVNRKLISIVLRDKFVFRKTRKSSMSMEDATFAVSLRVKIRLKMISKLDGKCLHDRRAH